MWRFLAVLATLAAILFVLALAGSTLLGEATGAADLRRAELAMQERVSVAQAVVWAPILPLLAVVMLASLLMAGGMAMAFLLLADRRRN